MNKLTYLDCPEKIALRKRIIPWGNKVIGLGGPDIVEYNNSFFDKGYTEVHSYEKDFDVWYKQMEKLSGYQGNITCNHGTIMSAPLDDDTFYDLDFCSTVNTTRHEIRHFRHQKAIYSFSEIYMKKWSSIPIFLSHLDERECRRWEYPSRITILSRSGKVYDFYRYCDSSPMIMVKNFNIY